MSNKQRLELRQSQSLVMTPQLQQSIKLLQLSSLELSAYITQELEKNPLLLREDAGEEDYTAQEPLAEQETPETVTEQAKDEGFEENYQDAWENSNTAYEASALSFDYIKSGGHTDSGGDYALDELQVPAVTLKEHITAQANLVISDQMERIIALHLTDLLDDNGYITDDFSSLAALLECDTQAIEAVLLQLQALDPPGVFARNVRECLALQLKDSNHLTSKMQVLLDHLDMLAAGELKPLQKLCGVDEVGLKELIREVKSLNPKPGANFSAEVVQVVQPDVYLRKDPKGKWVVMLNNDVLPKLLVNRRYVEEIGQKAVKKEDKKYLSEQVSAANWLIKVLDQRAQSILKVSTEIVRQQQEFFDKGIRYLKPLTLTAVAEAVGVHESTVSRVTTHKYMATPLGLYELKYFFSSSIHRADGGEDVSSRSVKFLIQELIAQETPGKVLSDEDIAAALKTRGVDIARRTVAKYREEAGIPTSSRRKREKRLGG